MVTVEEIRKKVESIVAIVKDLKTPMNEKHKAQAWNYNLLIVKHLAHL